MKVKVKNDTLFKLQPVLSSDLADSEKQFVESGTEYDVKFLAEAGHDHLCLDLTETTSEKQNGLTWYVRRSDVEVLGSGVMVTALDDTLFKRRPVLSSDLSDADKIFVSAGNEYELQSHSPASDSHTKLLVLNAERDFQGVDTWYVNTADIQLSGQTIALKVGKDTLFKAKPQLLNRLALSEKELVAKGTVLKLQSYSEVEGNHLKAVLSEASLGADDRITWYVYAPDIEIEGTVARDRPEDINPSGKVVESSDRGEPLNLPGFQGIYYSHDPIIAGGYFTWAQATHGGTRLPVSVDVVYGMIRIAEVMEEIRSRFENRPIEIVSWYRDPATNLRVGGAKMSRHIHGDGVNFVVEGTHPQDVYSKLDTWWGARGGLARASNFTHIDARGYRARWDYGF